MQWKDKLTSRGSRLSSLLEAPVLPLGPDWVAGVKLSDEEAAAIRFAACKWQKMYLQFNWISHNWL